MSDKKISELSDSGTITGSEKVPIVQGLITVKTTITAIRNFISQTIGLSQVLSNGTSTGDQSITSPDGNTILDVKDGNFQASSDGGNNQILGISAARALIAHDTRISFDSPIYNFSNQTANKFAAWDGSKNLVSSSFGSADFTNLKLGYYNVKEYGAVGDGTTDDTAAIQSAITASLAATGNVNLIFPVGTYKVNSEILVDTPTADVNIIGLWSTLKSGNSVTNTAVLRIKQAKKVSIENLMFDMNAVTVATHGIRLGDNAGTKYVGVARILNCDFFNFGIENSRGITSENTPFVSGLSANFNLPALIIDGCNFYNQNTSNSFNFSTATFYGIGIYLGELNDYTRIINCNFNWIRIGVYSFSGANADIVGCNFLSCFPKQSGSYLFGAVYVGNSGTNNGKVNITACKFNHMKGYCIFSILSSTDRPITVNNCHFIANATTAIYLSHTSDVVGRAMITNNWFDRTSQAFTTSMTNQPFGATLQPFIYLHNYSKNTIRGNSFINDATYGVLADGTSDNNIIEANKHESITGLYNLTGSNNELDNYDFSESFTYTGSPFTLSMKPNYVYSVRTNALILDETDSSDLTISGTTLTVTNPSFGSGDKLYIKYRA